MSESYPRGSTGIFFCQDGKKIPVDFGDNSEQDTGDKSAPRKLADAIL